MTRSSLPLGVGRRGRRNRAAALVVGLLVSGWIALSACSNQGEGERCEVANGDEDCKTDEGLVCVRKEDVNAPYNNADRCCPADRSQATHPACTTATNPIIADSAPPGDTGPAADVTVDSPTDTGSADAGEDASADAADEG